MTRDPLNDDMHEVSTSGWPKFEGAVRGFSDVIKSKRETEQAANWFAMHHQRDIKEMEIWTEVYGLASASLQDNDAASFAADMAVEQFRKRYPRIDAV